MSTDPGIKARLAHDLCAAWQRGAVADDAAWPVQIISKPGRPPQPELVPPLQAPRRKMTTPVGRAALIHALTHIEFNAINLALDAVYRFRGMPPAFYGDWLKVAAEEAQHFQLLRGHLHTLGHGYGDFPAHNGLWEMAQKTAHDPLVRMALVPRVLEARGLDATPAIMGRLRAAGDQAAVDILAIIERDEIGHVAIGSRWYFHLCGERGLEPVQTFRQLLKDYDAPPLKPPFNLEARRKSGFAEAELSWLEALS
ncbi:MAG TPA: ferritin-like domain-containing protein [Thiobacillaceae bacterium]|nr:ferritin-like domain-containing protein [Thiobacillaceae bacterium]